MKTLAKITIAISLACGLAVAQQEKPTVAVQFSGKELQIGVFLPLRDAVRKAILNNGQYTLVDNERSELRTKEIIRQTESGRVDESRSLSKGGQEFGATYLIDITMSPGPGGKSHRLSAKMTHSGRTEFKGVGTATLPLNANDDDLDVAAEELIEELMRNIGGTQGPGRGDSGGGANPGGRRGIYLEMEREEIYGGEKTSKFSESMIDLLREKDRFNKNRKSGDFTLKVVATGQESSMKKTGNTNIKCCAPGIWVQYSNGKNFVKSKSIPAEPSCGDGWRSACDRGFVSAVTKVWEQVEAWDKAWDKIKEDY